MVETIFNIKEFDFHWFIFEQPPSRLDPSTLYPGSMTCFVMWCDVVVSTISGHVWGAPDFVRLARGRGQCVHNFLEAVLIQGFDVHLLCQIHQIVNVDVLRVRAAGNDRVDPVIAHEYVVHSLFLYCVWRAVVWWIF